MHVIDGRTRHYGDFYRVAESRRDDRPLLIVWGNCQAEALRIVLDSSENLPFRTMRVPPVHELTQNDIPFVEHALSRTAVLVAQPVRQGYRDLPIGTADATSMMPSASTEIVWPVIRYAGLYPFQIIVRHPSEPSATPPVVPYHDLRTVLTFRRGLTDAEPWKPDVAADRLVEATTWSIAELGRRERKQCDVAISDALLGLGADAAHTINHPANGVLLELGRRVLAALDSTGPTEPGRELLGGVRSPLAQPVIDALELDAAARPTWVVDGVPVTEEEVHRAHMSWYAERPYFVDAALTRYAALIEILGLDS